MNGKTKTLFFSILLLVLFVFPIISSKAIDPPIECETISCGFVSQTVSWDAATDTVRVTSDMYGANMECACPFWTSRVWDWTAYEVDSLTWARDGTSPNGSLNPIDFELWPGNILDCNNLSAKKDWAYDIDFTIDTSSWPEGTYFIKLCCEDASDYGLDRCEDTNSFTIARPSGCVTCGDGTWDCTGLEPDNQRCGDNGQIGDVIEANQACGVQDWPRFYCTSNNWYSCSNSGSWVWSYDKRPGDAVGGRCCDPSQGNVPAMWSYCGDGNVNTVCGEQCEGSACCNPATCQFLPGTPDTPILTAPPVAWINYNPNFQAQVTDPDNDNVTAYFTLTGQFVNVAGNTVSSGGKSCYPTNCSSGYSLGDGQYSWKAYAEDSNDCTSATTPLRWLGIDKTAPSCTIAHSPDPVDSNDSVTFSVNASDPTSGVALIEISVNGESKKTCSVSTTCAYTDGPYSESPPSHTYSATITDNTGNTGNCSGTFDVEAWGVNVNLTANPYYGPSGFFSTLTATVGGTAAGDIRYQFDCTNNGSFEYDITTSTNPYSYSGCPGYTLDSLARVKVTREGLEDEASTNLYISTLEVTPDPGGVAAGITIQFTATYDKDGPGGPEVSQNVASSANWSSSNTNIATINSTGLATGVANGTTIITATYLGLSDDATLNVSPRVSSYRVIISGLSRPPTATNLNRTDPDWCGAPPTYFFSWTYTDPDEDYESKFDFQIDTDSNFTSPVYPVDRTYNVSYPSGTQNNQSITVSVSDLPDYLTYNSTTYYWRVKVYDSNGEDSGWVSGSSFTTQPHHYPAPDFIWQPESPALEEETQFFDQTTYYGGSVGAIWSWTFQDADPTSSVEENPLVIFQSSGAKTVTLTVTDSDGYSCPVSGTVNTSLSLPKWKEIKPW